MAGANSKPVLLLGCNPQIAKGGGGENVAAALRHCGGPPSADLDPAQVPE